MISSDMRHFGDGGPFAGGGFDFSGGFEDVFSDIFGEFFGGSTGRRRGRGQDLRYNLNLKFEEAVSGVEKKIKIPRHGTCETCRGNGAKPGTAPQTCPTCRGRGQVSFQQGFFSVSRTCNQCHGQGTIIKEPCPTCAGAGRVRAMHTLSVKIPAGVDNGSRLKLRGEGESAPAGGAPGDLYVVIQVEPHPIFLRDQLDIVCDVPISFVQAALGAEIDVPTLDGKVKMKIPAGTQSGKLFRMKGERNQRRSWRPSRRSACPRHGRNSDASDAEAKGTTQRIRCAGRRRGESPFQRLLRQDEGILRLNSCPFFSFRDA